MDDDPQLLVKTLLDLYLALPESQLALGASIRSLALQLFRRAVPSSTIEDAFLLALARRLCRPVDAPLLVRSLLRAGHQRNHPPAASRQLRPLPTTQTRYLANPTTIDRLSLSSVNQAPATALVPSCLVSSDRRLLFIFLRFFA